MLWIGLGVLLIALWGARRVFEKEKRARYARISQEIEDDLRHILFDCVYPGYADRVSFSSWLTRRHLFWGRMVVIVMVSAGSDLRPDLEDMVAQRLLVLMQRDEFGSDLIVFPLFMWRDRKNVSRSRIARVINRR